MDIFGRVSHTRRLILVYVNGRAEFALGAQGPRRFVFKWFDIRRIYLAHGHEHTDNDSGDQGAVGKQQCLVTRGADD